MIEILKVNIDGKITTVTREELNKYLVKYPETNYYPISSNLD